MGKFDARIARLQWQATSDGHGPMDMVTFQASPELEHAIALAETVLGKPLAELTMEEKGGALWTPSAMGDTGVLGSRDVWGALATMLLGALPVTI